MWKRVTLALAVVAGMSLTRAASAQMGPGDMGGPGGFQPDPAMMEQMQQMGQEIMQNMQNAGVDPMQFFQEQMQNGNFDPQAMQQSLVDRGLLSQEMANRMNNMMNQMQQSFQNQMNPGMAQVDRTLDELRRQLNVSDEEWGVLLPRVQRIREAMAELQQGGDAANAPAQRMPETAASPDSPLVRAWQELKFLLQEPQVPDVQVSSKLREWRLLRDGARQTLESLRRDLVGIATLRQEAILLQFGLL